MAFRSIETKQGMNCNGKWMVEIWLYEDGRPLQMLESRCFSSSGEAMPYVFEAKHNYHHLTYRR